MIEVIVTIALCLIVPVVAASALMCRIIYLNRGLFMDGPEE